MTFYSLIAGKKGGGTLIGKDLKNGCPFNLKESHRATYIIGAPGTGKTHLMRHCILKDIARNDKAIVVLDPHTDLVRDISLQCPPEQAYRVVAFNPYKQFGQDKIVLGFNPFQVKDLTAEYEEKVQAILDVFAHSWYGDYRRAPLMQNTLETLVRTLITAYPSRQTSFLHMLLLTELSELGDYWRHKLSSYVAHNAALSQNWREWAYDKRRMQLKADIVSSRQKVKHVLSSDILSAILCQPTSAPCFDFTDFIAKKGVLLVGLRGLDKEGMRLIGSFILTQLLATVKLTAENKRLPCHIYADEFHNFSPESFVEIIDQARKFNLFCTVAHQRLNQLNDKTVSAVSHCDNKVVFRVHPDDAQKLCKHFTAFKRHLSPQVLSKLKDWEAVIQYKDGRDIRQVGIKTLASKYPENREVAAQIRQQSLKQGRTLAEIAHYKAEVDQAAIRKDKGKSAPSTPPESDFKKEGKRGPSIPPEPDDSDFRQRGKRPPSVPPAADDSDSSDKEKGSSEED